MIPEEQFIGHFNSQEYSYIITKNYINTEVEQIRLYHQRSMMVHPIKKPTNKKNLFPKILILIIALLAILRKLRVYPFIK